MIGNVLLGLLLPVAAQNLSSAHLWCGSVTGRWRFPEVAREVALSAKSDLSSSTPLSITAI